MTLIPLLHGGAAPDSAAAASVALTSGFDPIPIFYGTVTLAALGLTLWSGRPVLIKVMLTMLLAWVACNVIVDVNGYVRAPLLLPMADAILAVIMAGLAIANRNLVALAVFAIFVVIGVVHVAAFQAHTQGTFPYYLTLNLLFLAQVVITGVAGGWVVVADRLRSRDPRARLHAVRG